MTGGGRAGGGTDRRPAVALVFPSVEHTWSGAGRDLLAHDRTFAVTFLRCDELVREETGWSVLERLVTARHTARAGIDVAHPMLWALQIALAATLRERGVAPDLVVGRGAGEVAAAQVAGVLTAADAARVVCRRGAVAARGDDRCTGELSSMLAGVTPRAGTVPVHVVGRTGPCDGAEMTPRWWADGLGHAAGPLERVVRSAAGAGPAAFVELAPAPVLGPDLDAACAAAGVPGTVLGSLGRGRPDRDALSTTVGHLRSLGVPVIRNGNSVTDLTKSRPGPRRTSPRVDTASRPNTSSPGRAALSDITRE